MGRKIRIIENVEVIDIADKGKSIGRAPDGRIIMIDGAVPGDVLDVRVLKKRKGMFQAIPEEFREYSADRAEPFCAHFGTCGGCKWQNLRYQKQIALKQKAVHDALTRIAHIDDPRIQTILGSATERYYRNKLEFTFTNQRWLTAEELGSDEQYDRRGLGFHVPGSFARVLDLSECHLQPHPSNAIRNFVRKLALDEDVPFQNIRDRSGMLRNLIVRNNDAGEVMIALVVIREDREFLDMFFQSLTENFPEIVSCYYCVNEKLNDSYFDLPFHHFSGKSRLPQTLGHVDFAMGPKSFYQTNPAQARVLYDVVVEMADLQKDDVVLDLYCGIGTITLYLARACKHITGVEEVQEAIEDARENAQLNGIENASFYEGDVMQILESHVLSAHGKPDVIVTDPPRAGMHARAVQQLLAIAPAKIVYVSCNPSTQARDIALLAEGYDFIRAQPVDMFPHTSHIENVALLLRKEGYGIG